MQNLARRIIAVFPILLILVPTAGLLAAAALQPGLAAPQRRPPGGSTTQGSATKAPTVNLARLRQRIEGLSVFGRPPGGTFADGVSRVAYSDADVAGRRYVMDQMRAAGLAPRIDAAGNVVGRREGRNPALPPILFGSHIDSVPNGGNFDGPLGTFGALEVMQALAEAQVTTEHPLEMVVWVNEEGVAYGQGLDGSGAVAGDQRFGEDDPSWNGVRRSDAIRKIGGDPARIAEVQRRPGSIHCYLELHIEQGGVLEKSGASIGVVEGIVGIDRFAITIDGVPNHAGTTPMADRQDALVAASRLVLAVSEVVRAEPGRQVGTVGQLTVSPNAPNVVPGQVKLTIELRDLSATKVTRLAERIGERAKVIGDDTRTAIAWRPASHHEPAMAAPPIMDAIDRAATTLGAKTMRLPSGAGHDAQMMAKIGPMGMIFVPSIGGISHSPREATRWEDCARGAAVLLQAVLATDRMTVR